METLFYNQIVLDWEQISNRDIYPFNLRCLQNFQALKLKSPVTILVGENGSGKSTLLEALAINLRLNPEGGTQNFNFRTNDTHSCLYKYLRFYGHGDVPKTKFFLRAESFYNFSSELERLVKEDGFYELYQKYGGNYHEVSHGESFLKLVQNRFTPRGLYILDEPEAALSPSRQMTLLCLIDDLVKQGCQFIIASHSPILISYYRATIYDLDHGFKEISYFDTEIYQNYKLYLNDPLGMQRRLFEVDNNKLN